MKDAAFVVSVVKFSAIWGGAPTDSKKHLTGGRMRAQGLSWKKIAKQLGLGAGTFYGVVPANKPTC